ncbi:glyoxylate/hydroxypyruvate reductase A [Noviherbaspirillum cavernae]|uniref:Glyoxylate/hydroxypyruvate reductase A n=1 Tax=Noviherbaspirillum cavernae TaxID=2320862 RepID=A0A418X4Z1_9BURK|nr:glyoxylate/hydroxypyruvate reductase A [Noviherbaspirillum cavernae]RJG07505.1 glyoxylate/hydroxypyruvate reductase A [Noviherbaspirillum cavernae]
MDKLNILFHATAGAPEQQWLAALNSALPDADIRVWQEGDRAPADFAIVWKPRAAMLAGRSDLKAIFNLGAGVDAILQLGDSLPAGVPVIRLDDAGMGAQMAEYVTQAVLSWYRRADEYEMQRRERRWQFLPPFAKADFSVGVLGLGVLGTQIAQALQAFDFPLHGWSRTRKTLAGVICHAGDAGLDTFLRATKVLVCVLPLTADTRDILNAENLGKLQRGAYLVNVARGAHVVDADLLALIATGQIAGAKLDVFREEPLPTAHPFWQEARISITPHISALTQVDQSARQIADKIQALKEGREIAGVVDFAKGY